MPKALSTVGDRQRFCQAQRVVLDPGRSDPTLTYPNGYTYPIGYAPGPAAATALARLARRPHRPRRIHEPALRGPRDGEESRGTLGRRASSRVDVRPRVQPGGRLPAGTTTYPNGDLSRLRSIRRAKMRRPTGRFAARMPVNTGPGWLTELVAMMQPHVSIALLSM